MPAADTGDWFARAQEVRQRVLAELGDRTFQPPECLIRQFREERDTQLATVLWQTSDDKTPPDLKDQGA
jgi:hypothetical protein